MLYILRPTPYPIGATPYALYLRRGHQLLPGAALIKGDHGLELDLK